MQNKRAVFHRILKAAERAKKTVEKNTLEKEKRAPPTHPPPLRILAEYVGIDNAIEQLKSKMSEEDLRRAMLEYQRLFFF